MPIRFRRLFFVAAFSFCSALGYGQDTAVYQAHRNIPEPLYIINSTIIANGLAGIDPQAIKSMVVYKGASIPDQYRNAATGIIGITYGGKIKSKSFAAVGRQHGVRGPIRVELNGRALSTAQATALRIAPAAIEQVQVRPATADTAATTLAIRLAVIKPTPHPPGTIMIR